MRPARSPRSSVSTRLRAELCAGVCGGLFFAILIVAFNVAALRSLIANDLEAVPIFLIGSILAFAPAVICGAVGLLRSSSEEADSWPPPRLRYAPVAKRGALRPTRSDCDRDRAG